MYCGILCNAACIATHTTAHYAHARLDACTYSYRLLYACVTLDYTDELRSLLMTVAQVVAPLIRKAVGQGVVQWQYAA